MSQDDRSLKIFGGLTAAAVAAVLVGTLTYDKWLPSSQPEKPVEPAAVAVTTAKEEPKPAAAPEASSDTPVTKPASTPPPEEKVKAPEFDTVRVERSGEAIVAGTAQPGAEVTIKRDGVEVGKAVANAEGAWVVVPEKPLAPGAGALSIEQKAPGSDKIVTSEQTVAVAVPEVKSADQPMVALLKPDEPANVLQAPDATPDLAVEKQPETGQAAVEQPVAEVPAAEVSAAEVSAAEIPAAEPAAPAAAAEQSAATAPVAEEPAAKPGPTKLKVALDSVDYNDKGGIVFSGRAGAGASVRIYVDNAPVGDATSGIDGKWRWVGMSEIAPGGHALRVDQIDVNGKVLNRIELPFMREEPERVVALNAPKPEEPAVSTDAGQLESTAQPVETPSTVAAAVPVSEPEVSAPGRIVIQPGNNLWKLSRVIYGRGRHYTVIYQANRELIRNPNRIYPGQIFTTPNAKPPAQIDPKRKVPLSTEEGGVALD